MGVKAAAPIGASPEAPLAGGKHSEREADEQDFSADFHDFFSLAWASCCSMKATQSDGLMNRLPAT